MALTYLSGDSDEIGSKKSRKAAKDKRQKNKGKRKKKVAKIALASVRGAFLTLATLNMLKLGHKLAVMYKKPASREALRAMWEDRLGGDFAKLTAAVKKGSKEQISGEDYMGVAAEVLLANGAAALAVILPLLKKHGAVDDSGAAEIQQGIDQGKETLANDDSVTKTTADMGDSDVGIVKKKGSKQSNNSGGGANDNPSQGSFFSPLGLFFKTPLLLSFIHTSNPLVIALIAIVALYCGIGMVIFPFYQWNWLNARKYVSWYVEKPKDIFYSIINLFKKKIWLTKN